ncbi:hypothetical protein GCM10009812_15780 [Nocardioides marinus]
MGDRPTQGTPGRGRRPTSRPSRAVTSRPRRLAGSGPRPAPDPTVAGDRGPEESGDPLVPPPPARPGGAEPPSDRPSDPLGAAGAERAPSPGRGGPGLGRRGLLSLVAVVAALTVVVAVEAVVLWRGDEPSATVSAERPVVVPERTWRPAVEAAAQGAEIVLGASWESYDEGIERARGVMTDEFADTYLATKEDVREEFVDQRTEVEVRVLGQAVTRATGSSVQALLFFNQYVTKKGAQTSFSEYRALVTVVDTPDGWLIDQIDTQ